MTEKIILGEEHHQQTLGAKQKSNAPKTALIVVGVMLLSGVSFAGGVQYQKGKQKDDSRSNITDTRGFGPSQSQDGRMRFEGGRRPNIGEVTAVDASNITVSLARGGTSMFKITSDTKITNEGSTASMSDIKTGDRVAVETSSNDDTTASRILINPQMMGPQNQIDNTPSSGSSTQSPNSI